MLTAGAIGFRGGYNEDVSGGLAAAGLTAALLTPIVHLAHGNGGRAGASYLIRSVTTSMGMFVGVDAGGHRRPFDFDFEGMLWGAAAGLAIGSAFDAMFLHDERSQRTWSPTVTASHGETRLGISGRF